MNIIREIQKRWFPKKLKCVYRKDVLEYVLKHHKYTLYGKNHGGLCISICNALQHYDINAYFNDINAYLRKLKTFIPLFTNKNAVLFRATHHNDSSFQYWWEEGVWDTGRLDFLKWLIKQYKDDKTNLKEL